MGFFDWLWNKPATPATPPSDTPIFDAALPLPLVKRGTGPSAACIALIEKSEGCATTAYVDVDGSYVLGYGCKIFDGLPVVKGQTCTAAAADRNCRTQASKCAMAILSLVKHSLTQGQLDALVDFVYNVGIGSLQQSTLLRTLIAGQPVTESMFTNWDKITKDGQLVVLPALLVRRQAEYQLFIG